MGDFFGSEFGRREHNGRGPRRNGPVQCRNLREVNRTLERAENEIIRCLDKIISLSANSTNLPVLQGIRSNIVQLRTTIQQSISAILTTTTTPSTTTSSG